MMLMAPTVNITAAAKMTHPVADDALYESVDM
jgi:hypothetical protein